jgi:hypothetical protein
LSQLMLQIFGNFWVFETGPFLCLICLISHFYLTNVTRQKAP